MPAQTANLYLLEDLEEVGRTSELAQSDLAALHAVADWIKTYVVKPHKDLGRAGTVCPFVPASLERKTLWLAPKQIADRDVPEVLELPTIPVARAVSVREAWSHRRLEVLPGRRGVAQLVGASHGESAVHALAEELRRLPWRMGRD